MDSAASVKRRLSKPKTHDNTSLNPSRPKRSQSSSSKKSRPPPDISDEQWTSYFDLKTRSDASKNLKQQLKQSFPETKRKLSLDSFRRTSSDSTNSTDTMVVKDRYTNAISTTNLGSNASAKSSPLAVSTPSPLARQLSVVHEGPGMDIASAIHLLQQLKKTASPEELVALHRALLPMKEEDTPSEPSPREERPSSFQHPSRRNSKLPPGLNTRGAPGDDLLRRLGDEVSRPRSKLQSNGSRESFTPTKRTVSGGSFSTTDLPTPTQADIPERSETPSNEQGYSQTGVYRTGTLRITNGAASPDPARMLQLDIPNEQGPAFEPAPESPGSPDFIPGRQMPASIESFPGPFRVLHSEQRQTSRPLPPPPPQSDSRRNSDASDVQSPAFYYDAEEVNPADRFAPEAQGATPFAAEENVATEMPVANEDAQFKLTHPPRLRHRPSYAGPLRVQDITPTETEDDSPRQTQSSIAQFATRLSTVYGEDDTDDDSPGTPNHALAKLTGESRIQGPREPRSIKSARSLHSSRPASMSHVDSGYGSSDSQRYISSTKPTEDSQFPAQAEQDGDNESLYTFNEFLKGPLNDIPSGPVSPSSPTMSQDRPKKDLPSFLGLREKMPSKRMSLPTGGMVSSDSLASATSSVGSESTGKTSKKLRKPMPLPERLKREKSFRVTPVSELGTDDFPLVSEEMNRSLGQRYHQPNDSEKNLSRRTSMISETQSIWDDGSREPEPTVPVRRNPFARKRSVSRGRKSQNRAQEPEDGDRPGRFPFLRSLSRSRSRRRRASIDSADCNTPTRRDFEGSAPPSGSVTPRAPLERDASVERGSESWRTGPSTKKKSKSMGMTEEMASELARSKSRDVAGHDRIPMHDRPRMARPRQSPGGHGRSPSVGPPKSGRAVEDFVPGWHSKENSPQSTTPPRPDAARRPFSMYADSIPPMPDMPIDVAAKAARANKRMEKKKKDAFRKSIDTTPSSAPASAAPSAQPSAASSPNVGKVRQAVKEREEQEQRLEDRIAKDRDVERLRVGKRSNAGAKDINIAIRELQGSSSEQSSILSADSRPSTADRSETTAADSSISVRKPQQNGFAGFDKQAALWRERRQSLGTYLPSRGQVQEQSNINDAPDMDRLASPEIVVSRYITPQGKELAARAQANHDPTGEAARHADLYRSLLDEDDARPFGHDIPRSDSAYSSASSAVSVPKYQDLPDALVSRARPTQSRTVSGITTTSSVYSSQYTALPRTRSPGGRVRTPSGKFYAYEPTTHASQAERSRASSLGKLQPAPTDVHALSPASSNEALSTIFSDTVTISSCGGTIRAKPKNPHQRHNFPDNHNSRKSRSSSKPRRPRPVSSHSSNLADRYSGGLGWEWDRQSGFGGSAGTRLTGEQGTRRKGQRLAESFGVDLGDVPIFLCQSPDGLSRAEQQQKKGYFAA